jgi:hypothetical protein
MMAIARCNDCGGHIVIALIKGLEDQGVKFFDSSTQVFYITSGNDIVETAFGLTFHKCGPDTRPDCAHLIACLLYPKYCRGCGNWTDPNDEDTENED